MTHYHPIRIYLNKIETSITFKIKRWYYLELFVPETMRLLRNTKSKIFKTENSENVSVLEIAEAVSVHCNVLNNVYQRD